MRFQQDDTSASELLRSLCLLHKRLEHAEVPWILGGSCALWLQGVSLSALPRDIDVYTDDQHVPLLHELLFNLATDEPTLDESGIYSSRLSHYRLGEYAVELVGGFRIRAGSSSYLTEVEEILAPAARQIKLDLAEGELPLMPLSHELVFNILRSRPDRYQAVAEAMAREPKQHAATLRTLIRSNSWSEAHLRQLKALFPWAIEG
ncbi:hypothetical protein [Paenibacillus apis]|uniref:Uncharacterized protein n=1 Tax=Paenibacillus apis TaxID=1792174 RepID=A0A920CMR2_9BACL|nr:hypothetical protein [Paenibacillus apis]GIO42853.1 hypothetical protein J41TS4_26110 [Paenibacillus apis]